MTSTKGCRGERDKGEGERREEEGEAEHKKAVQEKISVSVFRL